jgi:Uncharacterised nucleotidyltransferase
VADRQERLREALKRAASALKQHGPPFALAGSYALWVHGSPEPVHDVDLAVAESDVEQAAVTLAKAGFEIDRPAEDWLFKAHLDGVFVDVLHRLNGRPVDAELLSRTDEHEVMAIRMPVLRPTDMVIVKLLSLNEHYCDFSQLLPVVRAVREQLDWPRIQRETADNAFAAAFLFLTDRVGITSGARPDAAG